MNILAFETSCDETSVAVVQDGIRVLSCVIASSMKLHEETGGIIPENAARKQIEYILPVLEEALNKAFPDVDHRQAIEKYIDAIAVTVGPGLIGSLLVGVETAKTLATIFDKQIIPVNHIQAHIYGAWLETDTPPKFPAIALVVSGGHTDFVQMPEHGKYIWIGGTRDDAAGECFDKCARLIGLPYPGGPSISKAAEQYMNEHPDAVFTALPRPMIFENNYDLSFSGLKTAVSRLVAEEGELAEGMQQLLAAEIQSAIVDTLHAKANRVSVDFCPASLVLCGGVSGNSALQKSFKTLTLLRDKKMDLHVPFSGYTTDNAAMIGSCAFFNLDLMYPPRVNPNPELHF